MSGHDLEPLDAHVKGLLDAERARPAASPELRDRVFARVEATLGLGGPSGGGGGGGEGGGGDGGAPSASGASQASAGGAGAGSLFGGLLPSILLGMALGGAVIAVTAARSEPASTSRIAAPASPTTVDPAPQFEAPKAVTIVEAAAGAAPTSAATAPPPPSTPAGRDANLAAERAILDDAQRALAGGRGAASFELLARHASEFPRGRLSEEREGLWIRALVSAGRIDEARERAARFRRLFPRSMLLPALESTLGTIP
jgi:hypothetical protein